MLPFFTPPGEELLRSEPNTPPPRWSLLEEVAENAAVTEKHYITNPYRKAQGWLRAGGKNSVNFIITILRPPRLRGLSRHPQWVAATTYHNVIPSGETLSLATVAPLETGSRWDE